MNRKGPWEGYRVVSFPPSFARTFLSKERRLGTRQPLSSDRTTENEKMAYRNIRKERRSLGSPLSWRLICKKSYAAFSNDDLEKLNGLTLHSVKVTHWCPPPGIPLSVVRMLVSKV